mmetsp:Transcript_18286/g.26593  ORF Transcript_18286/g.26593 Transcript_18286/m.26593 type:complete len:221 (-) Transcript_18286:109-771(-)|eukprot:CAMPEP_0113935222 /NCGR_PEP_ID=MMETSP1339-20121228/2410_1 /TAXON_ID=94617 /ORGANISM="Fibrocapsa japonica" /LENGTH=220 /DNA_ID=CAMNT_0000937291 /DNA_START=43 /DNA_END=705 /DNA_ORIENTATION=+ /assembly_acc=CAM_ASM_000762
MRALPLILTTLTWLTPRSYSFLHSKFAKIEVSGKSCFGATVLRQAEDGISEVEKLKQENEALMKKQIEGLAKFPYDPLLFPELRKSENYWKGATEEYMWEQNRKSVYIHIPVDETVDKSDVDVQFKHDQLHLKLGGQETKVSGLLYGAIIVDECNWVWESDSSPPFITIELTKFIETRNWESLFDPNANVVYPYDLTEDNRDVNPAMAKHFSSMAQDIGL